MPWLRWLIGILPLSVAAVPAFPSTELTDVRLGKHVGFTRIVVDLNDSAAYRISGSRDSVRRILEIDGEVSRSLDCCEVLPETPLVAMDLLPAGTDRSQLVLTLDSPLRRLSAFGLGPDPAAGRGHRIVIDVYDELESAPAGQAAPSAAASPRAAITESPTVYPDRSADGTSVAASLVSESNGGVSSESSSGEPYDTRAVPVDDEAGRREMGRSTETRNLRIDFSGVWRHAYAWNTSASDSQKFETFLEPRWDARLSDTVRLTAILRMRLDAIGDLGPDTRRPANYSALTAPWSNHEKAELSLRELYFDFDLWGAAFRVGKQQVVWGQADGFKVLDVVNPQSFREFILDDFDNSRIPLWSVNAEVPVGDLGSLQLLWIPDTTYHELAEPGTPYALTTPRLIPQLPISAIAEPEKPDDLIRDSDVGAAYNAFWGGWDLSVNYLYRYLDNPLLRVTTREGSALALTPEYARSHLLGGTFSNAFGEMTLRGEFGYNSHSYHASNSLPGQGVFESPELTGVLGLDWLPTGSQLVSIQWFASRLFDYSQAVNRDRNEQLVSALYESTFAGSTWRLRGTVLHSLNDHDTQVKLRLFHWLRSSLELHAGVDAFFGSELGLFGQFDQQDRVVLGFEYSY